MNLPPSTKIVILGAGIIGCSVCFELCQRGFKPILVDREPQVASGASGKAAGFLAKTWSKSSPIDELSRFSFDLYEKYTSTLFPNVGYRRLEAYAASVSIPIDSPFKGSPTYTAFESIPSTSLELGWLYKDHINNLQKLSDTSEIAQIHPKLYVNSIFQYCIEHGAKYFHSKVNSLDVSSNSIQLETFTPDGKQVLSNLEADIVVVCMGGWSDIVLSPILKAPVMDGIKATSIVLQAETPATAIFTDWFTYGNTNDTNQLDPEIYPRPDGTVFISGGAHPIDAPEGGTSEVKPEPETVSKLCDFAVVASPLLAKAPLLLSQACLLPATVDDKPIIGKLDIPPSFGSKLNLYVATGHSVWGILNGPGTGYAMAELIVNGKQPFERLAELSPNRFFCNFK